MILENYDDTSLKLTKNDLSDKNMFLKKKDVHLGFAAEQELRQLRLRGGASLESSNKFRKEAMQFVLTLLEKFFCNESNEIRYCQKCLCFQPQTNGL